MSTILTTSPPTSFGAGTEPTVATVSSDQTKPWNSDTSSTSANAIAPASSSAMTTSASMASLRNASRLCWDMAAHPGSEA